MSRAETATPPPDTLLYEAVDSPSNLPNAVTGFLARGGRLGGLGVATGPILGFQLGAPVRLPFFGRWWEAGVSGAGGVGRQTNFGTAASAWPVGVDTSQVAPAGQYPTRTEYTVFLYRVAPLVLDVPFGVSLAWQSGTQNLLSLNPATHVGIEVSSRAAVNGGNWTRYMRIANGGALASADLGVHPDAGPLHVGFRYDHVAGAPELAVLFNGAVVESFVGVANMPQPRTFAAGFGRLAITQNSAIVGQTDAWVQSHLRIDRLPGYPV